MKPVTGTKKGNIPKAIDLALAQVSIVKKLFIKIITMNIAKYNPSPNKLLM
jgi:hypothetical protein